jgi:hypothetical protein
MLETTVISEAEFDKTYKPIPGEDNSDWRDWRDIPEGTPVERVWTVVEGDDGEYILTGYHTVNYIARVVTEVPWEDEGLEVECEKVPEE